VATERKELSDDEIPSVLGSFTGLGGPFNLEHPMSIDYAGKDLRNW
jgi:hypothetical protein